MAETQVATHGYMGEAWLHNGTQLYELRQVKGFPIPNAGERDQVETTHLKSPNWRRQYIDGFYADSDFDITLNSRPLSDTDALLATAHSDGATRAMKLVIPEAGVPAAQVELTVKCMNYARGEVSADGVMEATATFRVVTIDALEAYSA